MTLKHRILTADRICLLKQSLKDKVPLRIMEAHDGLSALIANNSFVKKKDSKDKKQRREFDGLWISSLTDSAAKGHPDTGAIDFSSRLLTIQEILQVTNKFIIVDGDTGGDTTQFEYFCSKLENMGVSAVVIEDKQFPKRNSLEIGAMQHLEDPNAFASKINRAKDICLSKDFMIFARIESFIAGFDLNEALLRARIYLQSKADGVLIHSNKSTPEQIFSFLDSYKKLCSELNIFKPVIVVPTSYNQVTEDELHEKGAEIVIHANHLLRAAHKAMHDVCETILTTGRTHEISSRISSVKEIFEEVGFLDVVAEDALYEEKPLPVILLSAGKPYGFCHSEYHLAPIWQIPINNEPMLAIQLRALKNLGLSDVTMITGYGHDLNNVPKVNYIYNKNFQSNKSLSSLILAQEKLKEGGIVIFGDVIFDEKLLQNLLGVKKDIVIVVDDKVQVKVNKKNKSTIDFVTTAKSREEAMRRVNLSTENVVDIGVDILSSSATHEFVGVMKLSHDGAKIFMALLQELQSNFTWDNPKVTSINDLDLCDILRLLIKRNCSIEGLSVNSGWAEIHEPQDAIDAGQFYA